MDNDFSRACLSGNLELVKTMEIPRNINLNHLMDQVCFYEYIDVAKWLHSNGVQPDMNALYLTCVTGNVDIGKWLYSLGVIPNSFSFEYACRFEHINFIKWLYSIGTRPRFRISSKLKNFELSNWLYCMNL